MNSTIVSEVADDLYKILGVAPHASAEEIREAYKHGILQHHPDKGGEASAFRLILFAYRTLSSSFTRKQYDGNFLRPRRYYARMKANKRKPTVRPGHISVKVSIHRDLELLGAGIPPKKKDPNGQTPRARLLRALHRLEGVLGSLPGENRLTAIKQLSETLRLELIAFMELRRRVDGSDGKEKARLFFPTYLVQERFWLCFAVC